MMLDPCEKCRYLKGARHVPDVRILQREEAMYTVGYHESRVTDGSRWKEES